MITLLKAALAVSLPAGTVVLTTPGKPVEKGATAPVSATSAKIQVAILLDVSNSMDGLIEQAKSQLWNMVSVLGKAKCAEGSPEIQIALYEYGRPTNSSTNGYIKQINGFLADLDSLSENLFSLQTNGGDEYCGHVMYNSLTELKWDTGANVYKVIFIAGNEDFLQGNVPYTKACSIARKKGVAINTIFCGDRMEGIREHWNIIAECGTGSYTNINADATIEDIPTPYDSTLFVLNDRLNNTYIAYGAQGLAKAEKQSKVDKLNYNMNKSVAAKRVAVKSQKTLYSNQSWDLVDAFVSDSTYVAKVDSKTLPASLQGKSKDELKVIVEGKNKERSMIQKQIAELNAKRELFVKNEKEGRKNNNTATLESEVEKIIKQQARQYNFQFE